MTDREVGARACEIAMPLWERGYEVRWRRDFNAMTEMDCLLFEIHRGGYRYGCAVSVFAMELILRPEVLPLAVLRQVEAAFLVGEEVREGGRERSDA